MWIKLDDGFATHPKVMAAGAIPALIQVRAICYASQHKTDGFIPSSAVILLLSGLDELGIDLGQAGEHATFGCQGNEIDWAPKMIEYGLWEERPGGYYVHDYLDWNLSKREYESFINKKRKAGKKGMKARWGKASSALTPIVTDIITNDITKPYHPTSTSTDGLNPLNAPSLTRKDNPDLKSNGHATARDYRCESKEVLAFLNLKTGKQFREVEANLSMIEARLKSGVDVQTCKTLIARKVRDWTPKPEMVGYLRPETLFNKTKFETYLAEVSS